MPLSQDVPKEQVADQAQLPSQLSWRVVSAGENFRLFPLDICVGLHTIVRNYERFLSVTRVQVGGQPAYVIIKSLYLVSNRGSEERADD